jgi:hypothetical protein
VQSGEKAVDSAMQRRFRRAGPDRQEIAPVSGGEKFGAPQQKIFLPVALSDVGGAIRRGAAA